MPPSPSRRGFLQGAIAVGGAAAAAAPALAEEGAHTRPEGAAPGVPGDAVAEAPVALEIDGVAWRGVVPVEASLLEVLRDRAGNTAPKLGCGHGACGACAVRVDGRPVASCLHPATSAHNRKVQTARGVGAGQEDGLHPVQRAFAAEDALQCGYCTPGFVVAATTFYESWRASRGNAEPSRDEVAAALAGHLCRCGAYEAIHRAVVSACVGRHEAPGAAAARVDAVEKLTGQARYTVDVSLPGQQVGLVLRSPHAHARVRRIDISKAERVPGVAAVVRMTEVGKRVRFVGQEIVALAAVDRETARAALSAVDVEYEVLPAVVSAEQALKEGAPRVYERGDDTVLAAEMPLPPARWQGNLRGPLGSTPLLKTGNAERTAADPPAGAAVSRALWTTQPQVHNTLEPHAVVAFWKGDEPRAMPDGVCLEVWLSTQAVNAMAEDCAERWHLPVEAVRVRAEHVGGGFGTKAMFEPHIAAAVELSKKCGKPVQVVLDRAEMMTVGGFRPGQRVELGVVADGAGELAAMTMESQCDGGVGLGTNLGGVMRLLYPSPTKHFRDWDVATHVSPARPFRGPGGSPAFWALEQAVDEVAAQRGEDPITLRRRWDPHPARNRLYDAVETLGWWRDRGPAARDAGRYRRGVGLGNAAWFYFAQSNTEVALNTRPGGLTLSSAVQDMGNGTRTMLVEGVRRVLDLPREAIEVRIGDSGAVHGCMSAGSRTTASMLPAAVDAAEQLAKLLFEEAVPRLGLAEARSTRAGIQHAGGLLPWAEVLQGTGRRTVVGRRRADEKAWVVPFALAETRVGRALGAAVNVAEVEVDTWTGKVRVTRFWGGFAVGKIAVPTLARSQAEGGIVQGVGYALYEERRLDPRTGRLLTAGLEDYRMTGIGDCPAIEVHFDEGGYDWVNGGGFGLSELCTVGVAGAVGNAFFHATGRRCRDLPLRPDRVRALLGGAA